jgi:N-acetylneuraminic acid mutarotase
MLAAALAAAALAWNPLPPAALQRSEVGAARVGGSIYVVGGFGEDGTTTNAVERYDIRQRRWRRVRPMPDELNHTVAVAHRGRLYVSGGYASESSLALPSLTLLRYNPERNRWTRLAPAPTPRAAHAAAVIGNRLYVAGGANESGSLRSLEIYDFAKNRWRSGPDFRGPARNHTTGVASGGRFYVLAGRDAQNYTSVDRYEPRSGRWLKPLEMATPRGGVASARLRDGRIVVFGGEDLSPGGETIGEVELFDPRTGRWSRLPDMRTPRHGLGGAALGNRVFALEGGVIPGFSLSRTIEFLDVPAR